MSTESDNPWDLDWDFRTDSIQCRADAVGAVRVQPVGQKFFILCLNAAEAMREFPDLFPKTQTADETQQSLF